MPIRGRHVGLIAKYSIKYSIRGGVGLVFTLLALLFGLMVAHTLISPVEMAQTQIQREANGELDPEELQRQVLDRLVDLARPAVGWVLGEQSIDNIEDDEARREAQAGMQAWKAYLLDEHPALLSAIMLILMWGWPFIVAAGAFDLFSGDIASRGLRYQLLRADRGSIFVGRLLGMLATFVFVLTLLMATVTLYMGFKLPFFGWGALLPWAAFGLCALVVLSLPYLALCSWLSASFGSSMGSLVVTTMVIGGVPLFSLIASKTYEPAAAAIHALPWGIQHYVFHPDFGVMAAAIAGCLAYSAVFAFLGYRKFTTRDL